jgi:hypothetical protein
MAIPIPDFTGLANQQGAINKGVAGEQTLANRPDQNNQWGGVNWSRDPTTGAWTQNVNMSPQGQQLFNTTMSGQQTLAGQVGQGLNYNNVPGLMGAAGTSQQAIDANMALQRPMLDQARDRENSRLAAMGLTMGSDAYNSSQRNLNDMDERAYQNAISAGNTEYGNIFNRALQARQQGVGEANSMYGAGMQGLTSMGTLKDSLDPTKHLANVPGATGYNGPNVYNAGMDTYNAGIAQQNADRANTANRRAGYLGLSGNLLQGQGGNIASGIGAAGSWLGGQMGNWFNGGGTSPTPLGATPYGDASVPYNDLSNWGGNWDWSSAGGGGYGYTPTEF